MKVSHVFSVELDEVKRAFILKQHRDVQHCFADVRCFNEGRAYCFVCKCEHAITPDTCAIHLLVSGPVCKDLSKLKSNRGDFAGSYEIDGAPGTSGPTYRFGFKKVLRKQVIGVYGQSQIQRGYIYIYICIDIHILELIYGYFSENTNIYCIFMPV